eukprot:jgi/Tetstr1/455594/TSEL_042406.t1
MVPELAGEAVKYTPLVTKDGRELIWTGDRGDELMRFHPAAQAMLQAVGVGAQRFVAGAATLNWVLKDGLGRLGRISHFLPSPTSAMVGKSIGLTTHVATQPAFHKSFACGETMAEISAKTAGECVVMDNVGLALVVVIRRLLGNNAALNKALPLLLFPLLTIGDLHAINRELKSV